MIDKIVKNIYNIVTGRQYEVKRLTSDVANTIYIRGMQYMKLLKKKEGVETLIEKETVKADKTVKEKKVKEKKIKEKKVKEKKIKEKKVKEKTVKEKKDKEGKVKGIKLPFKKKTVSEVKAAGSSDTKKARGISLFGFVMIIGLVPLLISLLIVSVISISTIQENLETSEESTLRIAAEDLKSYCESNGVTAMNASDYYSYIDGLQHLGVELAIIADGIPCTTSIKNENDFRIREVELGIDISTQRDLYANGYYDKKVRANEQDYYAYYVPVVKDGQEVAIAFAGQLKESVVGNITHVFFVFIPIAVVLLLISIVIILLFSNSLSKIIKRIGKRITAISKGDLSEHTHFKSNVKEISEIVDAYDATQQRLATIIGEVKSGAEVLVGQVNEVTELSNKSAEQASKITDTVTLLSDSAAAVEENVVMIHGQMQEIGDSVNNISDSADDLYESADRMMKTNDEANTYLGVISENSAASVEAVETIANQIRFTNESIAQIDQAVELILSISEQTNLLSLNASIEAARAGEQGRGFAVVAQEIRALAEQSANGAEVIRTLSQTITEQSEKSVEMVEQVQHSILNERESIDKTRAKYDEHSKDISRSVTQIKAITEKAEALSEYKEKVVENVRELKNITEENAKNHAQMTENVSQIIESVKQVDEYCASMTERADSLDKSVDFFKMGS